MKKFLLNLLYIKFEFYFLTKIKINLIKNQSIGGSRGAEPPGGVQGQSPWRRKNPAGPGRQPWSGQGLKALVGSRGNAPGGFKRAKPLITKSRYMWSVTISCYELGNRGYMKIEKYFFEKITIFHQKSLLNPKI